MRKSVHLAIAGLIIFKAAINTGWSDEAKHVGLASPYKVKTNKKADASDDLAFRPETDPNKRELDIYKGISENTKKANGALREANQRWATDAANAQKYQEQYLTGHAVSRLVQ